MKKAFKFIGIGCGGFIALFFMTAIIAAIFSDSSEEEGNKDDKADSTTREKAEKKLEKERRLDSLAYIKAKKKFEKLKEDFKIKKDEFEDVTFYRHNEFSGGWPRRNTLMAGVNSSGYRWMESLYYGDDWLFHTHFKIIVGNAENPMSMIPTVPTHSDDHRTEATGNGVFEHNTYEEGAGIMTRIAFNYKKEIKVRLIGRKYNVDFTLSRETKEAIKKTYELSEAIKKMKRLSF